VFQELRMAVNEEMHELETALDAALEVLAPGGRLAVLSYHSGEDRRVKEFFAREVRGCICPKAMPRCGCGRVPRLSIVERGSAPDAAEVRRNPRARSARLRVGERL
jgi:16S rRNA (cytosine1402-N4)-methyltransferase